MSDFDTNEKHEFNLHGLKKKAHPHKMICVIIQTHDWTHVYLDTRNNSLPVSSLSTHWQVVGTTIQPTSGGLKFVNIEHT